MNKGVLSGLMISVISSIQYFVRIQASTLLSKFVFSILIYAAAVINTASGQTQSGRVYEFLNLSSTARITALGGYAVPGFDHDLGMALFYPSLINKELENQLSLNFVDYFGDISYGTAAFSRGFEKAGNFTMAIQYINYGRFTEADEFGVKSGEFTAGEYALGVGWGRQLAEKISIGSNLKFIFSSFGQYSSLGLTADVSLSYLDPEKLIASSLVFRNIGRQITKYHPQGDENLPFDIVFGISKKLLNAPLRFSLVAHNLHRYDLTYQDYTPQYQTFMEFENRRATAEERFAEVTGKLLRHAVFGMEFSPTKNFVVGIGYNYRRRQEMKVDSRMSTVGLSWGVGIKVSHFMFHYGRSNYHLAGAPNHFSISTNLESLFFRPADKPASAI
jgi:hypothetical protein